MDIPLREVQIIWDYTGDEPDAPSLLVMAHPEENGRDRFGTADNHDYSSSWGACNADFLYADDEEQLLMLFEKFSELCTFEGLNPQVVHEAFCVIPEYRLSLIWRGFRSHLPDEFQNLETDEAALAEMPKRRSTGLK